MIEPSSKEGRLYTLDLLRLWAIVLVVMGHCLRVFVPDFLYTRFNNFLWLSELPLFFFVAGYVHTKPEKIDTFLKFFLSVLKKAFWDFWPIITFALIRVYCFRQYPDFPTAYSLFIKNPAEGLWFFFVLFWVDFFFSLGTYLSHFFKGPAFKKALPLVTFLSFWLVLFILYETKQTDGNYLGVELALRYGLFYALGYLGFLFLPRLDETKKAVRLGLWLSYGVCLSVFLAVCLVVPSLFGLDLTFFPNHLLLFFGGVASTVVFYLQAHFLARFRFCRILSYGGRFTGDVYWAQPNLIKWWPHWVAGTMALQWLSGFALAGLVFLFVGIGLVLCYFIPFLHFAFFLRPYSRYPFERKWLALFR